MISALNADFDPIIEEIKHDTNAGTLTREKAWALIEKIIDLQIEHCLIPNAQYGLMLLRSSYNNNEVVSNTNSNFSKTVVHKIELPLAELIRVFSNNHGWLRARTVSRAVSGAIVSFNEYNDFLMDDVYFSGYFPRSIEWMKQHLKTYILTVSERSMRTGQRLITLAQLRPDASPHPR